MEKDLVVTKPNDVTYVAQQTVLINEAMKNVMKEGAHYGIVPGCGNKPTLLKPGAEKLAMLFGYAVDPEIEDLSGADEIRYRIKARLVHAKSGIFVGAGVGEASSSEEKYKWRAAVCDEEFEMTSADRRRIKFQKKYNKAKGGYDIEKIKQVRMEKSDIANTVLKMAKKRAQVDAILSSTAASDMFTQDIEDMPQEYLNGDKSGAKSAPAAQKPAPAAKTAVTEGLEATGAIANAEAKKAKTGKEYYVITLDNGFGGSTWEKAQYDFAVANKGVVCKVTYAQNGNFKNITGIEVLGSASPDDTVTEAEIEEPRD